MTTDTYDPTSERADAREVAKRRGKDEIDGATRDIMHVMYTRAGDADPAPVPIPLATYFDDCNLIEPRLLKLYDEILPALDARLGPSPSRATATPPATARRYTKETARWYAKRVLDRTGCRNRAALVRQITMTLSSLTRGL